MQLAVIALQADSPVRRASLHAQHVSMAHSSPLQVRKRAGSAKNALRERTALTVEARALVRACSVALASTNPTLERHGIQCASLALQVVIKILWVSLHAKHVLHALKAYIVPAVQVLKQVLARHAPSANSKPRLVVGAQNVRTVPRAKSVHLPGKRVAHIAVPVNTKKTVGSPAVSRVRHVVVEPSALAVERHPAARALPVQTAAGRLVT